jgi:hypothetical protein
LIDDKPYRPAPGALRDLLVSQDGRPGPDGPGRFFFVLRFRFGVVEIQTTQVIRHLKLRKGVPAQRLQTR